MERSSSMGGRAAILVTTSALLLAVVAAPAAVPVDTRPPPRSKSSATILPKILSKTAPIPVSLRTGITFWTVDDSWLPALKELHLGLDRHLRLQLEHVPPCRGVRSDVRGNGPAKTCPESIVGRGRLGVETRYPDLAPVRQAGKVTVFRGPSKGRTAMLYIHAELAAPITAEIVAPMEIKPNADGGIYGLTGIVAFPKIAGGYGSVTHIGLRFRKGVFTATCPRRGSLQVRQWSGFVDGSALVATALRLCD